MRPEHIARAKQQRHASCGAKIDLVRGFHSAGGKSWPERHLTYQELSTRLAKY